ncbi:MAG: DUF3276 family protein [Alistipes sp.]|nr:DUF3276 family protein [Alistipes sp.]
MTLNSDRESLAISEGYSESVFSRMIKAGHRTYFIDVKTTRQDDYYLSITELRKKITRQGEVVTERNKVFVYQEDIDKFTDSMAEVVEYLRKHAKCPTHADE